MFYLNLEVVNRIALDEIVMEIAKKIEDAMSLFNFSKVCVQTYMISKKLLENWESEFKLKITELIYFRKFKIFQYEAATENFIYCFLQNKVEFEIHKNLEWFDVVTRRIGSRFSAKKLIKFMNSLDFNFQQFTDPDFFYRKSFITKEIVYYLMERISPDLRQIFLQNYKSQEKYLIYIFLFLKENGLDLDFYRDNYIRILCLNKEVALRGPVTTPNEDFLLEFFGIVIPNPKVIRFLTTKKQNELLLTELATEISSS